MAKKIILALVVCFGLFGTANAFDYTSKTVTQIFLENETQIRFLVSGSSTWYYLNPTIVNFGAITPEVFDKHYAMLLTALMKNKTISFSTVSITTEQVFSLTINN